MLWYRPGDLLLHEFTTSAPSNGQTTSADPLPLVGLSHNGALDEDVTVTVELLDTGLYLATCTIPAEYQSGDHVTLRAYGVVTGVPARDVLFQTRLIGVDFTQLAGVSITLGPTTGSVTGAGEVSDGTTIVGYHFAPLEYPVIGVFAEDGAPVDMSAYVDDLAFVVFKLQLGREHKIAELIGGDVVLVEGHPHQVTLRNTTVLNQQLGEFRWALRRRTAGEKFVRAQGCYSVRPCSDVTEPS